MTRPIKTVASKTDAKTHAVQLLRESELRRIIDTVVRLGKVSGAEETEVHVDEAADALTRFANNAIHQNVAEHGLTVSVRTVAEGRTARTTTNRIDEDSLRAAIESSLSLAASQPKNPTLLAMPGHQKYRPVNRFIKLMVAITPGDRAQAVRRACDLALKNGQVAAGIFLPGRAKRRPAIHAGFLRRTRKRTRNSPSPCRRNRPPVGPKRIPPTCATLTRRNSLRGPAKKHIWGRIPAQLAPGRYTVILEPAAVLDLVGFLFYDFAATALQDKRSCLNERMGKQLFGKNISIYDDAYHPLQLGAPFDGEGMPRQKVHSVDRGVPKNLVYSRNSAKVARKSPTGHGFPLPNECGEAPMNLVFGGGNSSLEEMIASTERGLLVTRLWYIREVDAYEKIMTGMTRDGLFLVEKGRVVSAARNFRFNQSLLEMLRNVELMGPAVRATGEEAFEMVVPAMKVREFHFSEVTKF